MNENKKISLKEVMQVLSLFFILSVVSIIMIYAKFEQGVEDFWNDKEKYEEVLENSGIGETIDLDSLEIQGDVYEFDQNELEKRYKEANGNLNVFKELFDAYTK